MAETIADRYQILTSLGRGGMGEVFLANDLVLRRRVALKQIRRDVSASPQATERLLREARLAASMQHPNVVAVFDLLAVGADTFIVMEYLDARSLAELIRAQRTLAPGVAASHISQVAGALEAAHRMGVCHRDVKPGNILVTADGTAKLADFGIARGETDPGLTGTGMMVGSVAFMAPEVAKGEVAGAASDVFSLGATLFAAVEGHAPFTRDSDPPSSMQGLIRLVTETAPPAVHGGPLTGLIARMLDPDPVARPTAGEVQRTLSVIAADLKHAESASSVDAPTLLPGAVSSVAAPSPSVAPAPAASIPAPPAPVVPAPAVSVRATPVPAVSAEPVAASLEEDSYLTVLRPSDASSPEPTPELDDDFTLLRSSVPTPFPVPPAAVVGEVSRAEASAPVLPADSDAESDLDLDLEDDRTVLRGSVPAPILTPEPTVGIEPTSGPDPTDDLTRLRPVAPEAVDGPQGPARRTSKAPLVVGVAAAVVLGGIGLHALLGAPRGSDFTAGPVATVAPTPTPVVIPTIAPEPTSTATPDGGGGEADVEGFEWSLAGGTIPLGQHAGAGSVAFSRLGYVYTTDFDAVHVVDVEAGKVVKSLKLYGAHHLAVNDETQRLYVALWDSLGVVDLQRKKLLEEIDMGGYAWGVGVDEVRNKVLVTTGGGGNTVSIVSGSKSKVVERVKVSESPGHVAVDTAHNRLYAVVNEAVSIVDLATSKVIDTVKVGKDAWDVAVDPTRNRAYVTHDYSNVVSVIDTVSGTVLTTLNTEAKGDPSGSRVVVDSIAGAVFVGSLSGVTVIDAETHTVTAYIPTEHEPLSLALDSANHRVYVTSHGDNADGYVEIIEGRARTTG